MSAPVRSTNRELSQLLARPDRGQLPGGLAVAVYWEAVQIGLGLDVAFDEVDAIVMVDGYVHDGDTAVDALRFQGALTRG